MVSVIGVYQGKASRRRSGGNRMTSCIVQTSVVRAQGVSIEEAEKQLGKWEV